MRTVSDCLALLQERAATVGGLLVCGWNDPMEPPCVVFNLPSLTPETFRLGSMTEAEFTAWLVVADDTYQLDQLVGFVGSLVSAVETDGTVLFVGAIPGNFADAGSTIALPAYQLTFRVLLDVEDEES